MSKSKKRKYFIETEIAEQLLTAYGLNFKHLNWYSIRIYEPERNDLFFDWFHTQGTLCVNTMGVCKRLKECPDAEDAAKRVQSFCSENN